MTKYASEGEHGLAKSVRNVKFLRAFWGQKIGLSTENSARVEKRKFFDDKWRSFVIDIHKNGHLSGFSACLYTKCTQNGASVTLIGCTFMAEYREECYFLCSLSFDHSIKCRNKMDQRSIYMLGIRKCEFLGRFVEFLLRQASSIFL